MTTLDFSPLYRSSVGFDRMMDALDRAAYWNEPPRYPPYNIEVESEDKYRITMAVAGFTADDLTIEVKDHTLRVAGKKSNGEAPHTYLYRGITDDSFVHTFELAEYVNVIGAQIENGLLRIDLVRELPDHMRPRKIEIESSAPSGWAARARKLVEGSAEKAA